MEKFEKTKKRAAKKQLEMDKKQEIRKKMSVIASSTVNNDEEMMLDQRTWDKLKTLDVDELDKYIEESSDNEDSDEQNINLPGMSKNLRKLEKLDDEEQARERGEKMAGESDSDDSVDPNIKHTNRMAEEIEQSMAQQKEYHMQIDRKEAKRVRKTKEIVEL